ncbi:MAG TPA: WD40 repeat domain-containing protein [Gemmataceae bacterium]|nr:WD40 repeat domain-containing protein [Gemmataceae bacterium]
MGRTFSSEGDAVYVGLMLALLVAQQPAKPAELPPINPAQARLDQTLGGLGGPGFSIAADETGDVVAAGCENGTIAYWNKDVSLGVRSGANAGQSLSGHKGPVTALAWRSGRLASASTDGKINLWNLADVKPLQTLTASAPIRALALTADGKLLASAGDDNAVQLWDTATGKPTTKLEGHTDWVLALAFSPDGKLLASGGYDGTVRLWDVAGGKKLLDIAAKPPPQPNTPAGPANVVQSLAFSPDAKLLAVGGSDSQIHLFAIPDGKYARSLPGHASSVTGVQFHPSGTVLASCSKDRTVKLWNPTNAQMLKSLEGHTAWVQGVTFLARGTRLASVGADATVRTWELSDVKK